MKSFTISTVLIKNMVVVEKIGIIDFFFENGLEIVTGKIRREEVVIFCRKK